MDLDQLLIDLGQRGGSDLHLKVSRPPLYRISGDLIPQTTYPEVGADEMREAIYRLMGPERSRIFEHELDADFSYEFPGFARFRVSRYRPVKPRDTACATSRATVAWRRSKPSRARQCRE